MAELRKYFYTAKTEKGQIEKGDLTAANLELAQKAVEDKGLIVLSLEEETGWEVNLMSLFNRVSAGDKALFARQLATMVSAGYNLTDALKVIGGQTKNRTLKAAIEEIASDVESGFSLSTAMAKHRDIFNRVFIAVVRSGEATGRLAEVLDEMAVELERDYEFSSKLRDAMIYPVFILIAMIIVGALMMTKVIPQLKSIFEGANIELPWTTRAVIGTSNFLVNWWWLVLLVLAAAYFLLRAYIKSPAGNYAWSKIKLRLPVFGKLIENSEMTRMTLTFQILAKTGIPLLEAINITADTMENEIYKRGLKVASSEVERGVPFSVPLIKNSYIPAMISQMVSVGEQTGKIDEIFDKLSSHYLGETDRSLKTVASLIEPLTIVVLGILVGIMVFAIIVPIYNMSSAI
ncbi:type II secretion system F family protein [Patescibacteria group bacterium]|nr:type II secretion system F family protein [Patescibacteria group bacterium]